MFMQASARRFVADTPLIVQDVFGFLIDSVERPTVSLLVEVANFSLIEVVLAPADMTYHFNESINANRLS